MALRIAMWSGPRNISTAMMRAWENRSDTVVCDEPLYAHYLAHTGLDHAMAGEVIAAGETDWKAVTRILTGPAPKAAAIFYQKHMTHHLLPHIDKDWLAALTNCFLIRHPREVLLSYVEKRATVTPEDIGFPQQRAIFERVASQTRKTPIVIDAADFLRNPRGMLAALCARLGVAFEEAMLSWPPGPRESDGVWASHWYGTVWQSTGFAPYRPRNGEVAPQHESVLAACLPAYEALYERRLML